MSKSKGNVITPDEVVHEYGTDALRAYVMFLGPFDAEVMWDDAGIKGIARFLDRFWRLATEIDAKRSDETGDSGFARRFERRRHQIIKRLTGEMEQFRYNTAIAALMEYLNYLISVNDRPIDAALWKSGIETLTLLMAPFTPFIAEEVWQRVLGHGESIHLQPWPSYDEAAAADEWLTVVVQVNGKLRDRLRVAADINEEALGKAAMDSANVQRHIANRDVRRIIVRPGRLVNIVV